MAQTRFLELPEELFRALESAASSHGKTVLQWLADNLSTAPQPEETQQRVSENVKEESVAQRELWLMQL
jgi:hypothetical protein